MRLRRTSLAALAAVFLVAVGSVTPAGAQGRSSPGIDFVPGEILVGFRPGASAQDVARARADAGAVSSAPVTVRVHRFLVQTGQEAAAIARLKGHATVRFAEFNYRVHALITPNDPQFPNQWGLQNTGQTINGVTGTPGADISATSAWGVSTGSATIVVGDVDTGLDYNHPDLSDNVWNNPGGVGGCPAGTHGYNAIANSCDPMDDNGHGTHTAGTVGAVGNNGQGVAGVNWKTSLMGLKFLDSSGSGSLSDAIKAIDFAVTAKANGQANVRVLNNSWGGGGYSQALLDEINNAGANDILFMAAAGNRGLSHDVSPLYPCDYGASAPNVICVAASTQNDNKASFSDYGSTVHLAAPGTNILSTVIGGGYAYYNGTSMATPHVTGAAALILSSCSLASADLKNTILNTLDTPSGLAGLPGGPNGRLNVNRAIRSCASATPDFTLGVSPASQAADQGTTTAPYSITVASTGGFSGSVSLQTSIASGPGGYTGVSVGAPSPASVAVTPSASGSSSFTASSTPTGTPGTYTLRVTASSAGAGITHTTDVTFTVTPRNAGDFTLSVTPESQKIPPGTSGTYTVNVNPVNGFSGDVQLSVRGLHNGNTGTFSPTVTSPPANSSTLTVTVPAGGPAYVYTLTITGVSGNLTRSITATLDTTP